MRVQYLTKWHRDFENCATHIHDDDRIVTSKDIGDECERSTHKETYIGKSTFTV